LFLAYKFIYFLHLWNLRYEKILLGWRDIDQYILEIEEYMKTGSEASFVRILRILHAILYTVSD